MNSDYDLTIFQMNDSHAYLEPHNELFWRGGTESYGEAGGYARIATVFNRAREKSPESALVLDNGDTIHGTYAAVKSRGEAMIPVLNRLGLDAMTAHWEFAYGPDRFREVASALDYPVLAANVFREESGELEFAPHLVVERGGLLLGIVGMASNIVSKTMPPHFSEGLEFTIDERRMAEEIDRLRGDERVDLVIVLSHLGLPQELELAERVDGIDILLSGHTHNRLYSPFTVNGAVILQSGCHGSFLGRLDVRAGDSGVEEYSHTLIEVDPSIEPDPDVQSSIDRVMDRHRDMLGEEIGITETGLNRNTVMECTMDNVLLKSMLEETGAELAFSNGWRYGAPVPTGPVTVNDVWNIVPTDPPISRCRMRGREIWAMMEENLERTFSRDPYFQMGGYVKRCLGLNLFFKVENPAGTRIHELYVGGRAVEPGREYDVCFLTNQGVPEKFGAEREDLDVTATEALTQYLEASESVSGDLSSTIVPI
jgi:2',3'-cyclic-nucleotide 2'-phosphodiesterase (5'-nucleotidase family)